MAANEDPTYLQYVRRYRKLMFDLLHDEGVEHWVKRVVIMVIAKTARSCEGMLEVTENNRGTRPTKIEVWAEIFGIEE